MNISIGIVAADQKITQVKIWFQNRRNKWKRQLAADLEAASLGSGGRYEHVFAYLYFHICICIIVFVYLYLFICICIFVFVYLYLYWEVRESLIEIYQ